MVSSPISCTLPSKSRTFSWSPLMWPMFSAIKTRFFSNSVRCDFTDFLFDGNVCWSLILYYCGVLIRLSRPLAYLTASANVSWSFNNFLLTLLDLPFSNMAINILVSNQPVRKSQCSPSALNLEMNESQVSSFPRLTQRNLCILNNRFYYSLNLFRCALMAPSKSVPVSTSCSNISRVASPIKSKNKDRCCALSMIL